MEILTVVMPLLVCLLSGLFALYQLYLKQKDNRIIERLDIMQDKQAEFEEKFDAFREENRYDELRKDVEKLDNRLTINDEITKRVELALMINHHPEQTMIIEQLLQEYNGNHYIYTLAKQWAEEYNVTINPKLLNKLCRNSANYSA